MRTIRDDYGRQWVLNLPEAPTCSCGLAAVKMKAKGRTSGKAYAKWRCVKAVGKAAGYDYRDKCDLDEFPDKR